ncbi:hypothetical protein HOH87_05015 [bacterium]|jgi:hypothetical protein|nr:hypothetical protein [bacterium]
MTSSARMFFLIALGIGLGGYISLSTFYRSNVPQRTIKTLVEREMSKAFRREVQVDGISGNLITQAKLTGIRIASMDTVDNETLLEIDELVANYSLIRALRNNGDILAGIHTVDMRGVTLNLRRFQDDKWNLMDFLVPPPPGPGEPPLKPLTFRGTLFIQGLRGTFKDYHGWGKDIPETPFYEEFDSGFGRLNFNRLEKASISLSARFKDTGSPMSMNGTMNGYNGQFQYAISIPHLNTEKWGEYVFPLEGFSLGDDPISVVGRLESKNPIPKTGSPFYYSFNLQFGDLMFKTPYFPVPMAHMEGDLLFTNNPNVRVHLSGFKGALAGIPLKGHGDILIDDKQIDLAIQTQSSFSLESMKALFPALDIWSYKGVGATDLKVTGDLNRPEINGKMMVKSAYFYGLTPQALEVDYQFLDRNLVFSFDKGELFGGTFQGKGAIGFQGGSAFNMAFDTQDINLHRLFPKMKTHLSPSVNVSAKIDGRWDRFLASIHMGSEALKLFQQPVSSLDIDMVVHDGRQVTIESFDMALEDNKSLTAKGRIKNLRDLTLRYSGTQIPFYDVYPKTKQNKFGQATLTGTFSAPLIPAFFKSPMQHLSVDTDATFSHGKLMGFPFQKAALKMTYSKSNGAVKYLDMADGWSSIHLDGDYKRLRPQDMRLTLSQVEIADAPLLMSVIPNDWQPVSGKLSASVVLTEYEQVYPPKKKRSVWNALRNIDVKGTVRVQAGRLFNQPFDNLAIKAHWRGNGLDLDAFKLTNNLSEIGVSGTLNDVGMSLKVLPGTVLYFSDFDTILSLFGDVKGVVHLNGALKGRYKSPGFDLNIQAKGLQYNAIGLEAISGRVGYQSGKAIFKSLVIRDQKSTYRLNGHMDFSTLLKEGATISDFVYDMSVQFEDVALENSVELVDLIYREHKRRNQPQLSEKISNGNAQVIQSESAIAYSLRDPYLSKKIRALYQPGNKRNSLGFFDQIRAAQAADLLVQDSTLKRHFEGVLNGYVRAKSRKGRNPLIRTKLRLDDGILGLLDTKRVDLFVRTRADDIGVDLSVQDGVIKGTTFQSFVLASVFNSDGDLLVRRSEWVSQGQINPKLITGTIPISGLWDKRRRVSPMNVSIVLKNNDINLFSLALPYIDEIKNDGEIRVRVTGSLQSPVFNATRLTLRNAEILFNPETTFFRSPFRIAKANLKLKNNILRLNRLKILWKGEDTRRRFNNDIYDNIFDVSGSLVLREFDMAEWERMVLGLNLKFGPRYYALNLTDIYHGDMNVHSLTIKGDSYIPLSDEAKEIWVANAGTDLEKGPEIKAFVELRDGRIAFPTIKKKALKPSYALNVDVRIQQGVFVEGGIFGSGVFSLANNFYLELQDTPTDQKSAIHIGGVLNLLRIDNTLTITEGSVTFFDRLFEIMNVEQQRQFFGHQPDEIGSNTLSFVTDYPKDNEKQRLIPVMNVRSVSYVEQFTDTTDSTASDNATTDLITTQSTYKGVVALFKGRLDALQRSMIIEEYDVTNPLSRSVGAQFVRRYELDLESGSDSEESQEALKLILPDFLQTGDAEFAKLGQSQANNLFRSTIRPYEKRLARRVGLYDLRLDYNVGRALFTDEQSGSSTTDTNLVGLNMVADLMSEKLFLRVKTDMDLSSESRSSLSSIKFTEFELTYLITNQFSVNFSDISDYRETDDFSPRFSLTFIHEF